MSDGAALLKAIIAHPAEDTPRLVYADWLDESGQPERAEFVRVQVELARLDAHDHGRDRRHDGECEVCDRRARFARRELALLSALRDPLRSELPATQPGCPSWAFYLHRHEVDTPDEFTCALDRGFVVSVCCDARTWLRCGDTIRAAHPVTGVRLTTAPEMEGDEDAAWFDGYSPRFSWVDVTAEMTDEEMATRRYLPALCRLRWPGIAFELPAHGLPPWRPSHIAGG